MPNKKKLFNALVQEGYDNFESESSFNAYIDNADNRKKLFNALKEEGYDNFTDEKAFDEYLGYGSETQSKLETHETKRVGNIIIGGIGTQEEADSIFDANAKAVREKYSKQPDQEQSIPESELKRLQSIKDTAQKQIDEAGFFDRFFDADTRAAVAARNQAEEALETYEEAQHAENGWFDRNVMGVLRGIADKATDLSTWDFGVSGIASATALNDAYEKWENGEQLTSAEQNMLDAYGLATAVQAAYQDKVGTAYKVGGSLPESAAFSASFILNPAAGVGKKLAEATAKAAVKKYGTSLVSKLAKGAARAGGDVAEMAVATAIPGGFRVAEDYYNRLNGQSTFDIDENGIIRYGGQAEQEEADDAIWKAFGSQFIENYSEAMGNYFAPMGTMLSNLTSKGLKAAHLGKLADVVNDISSSQFSRGLKRFKEATKFDGLVGEYLEEVAGNVINAATVGDMNFKSPEDPRSVFNPETNIETFLSCALMSGTMYAVEAPVSIYNRNVAKRNLNNADTEASKLWGDRWNDMRSQMDEADPQLLAQLLTGVQNAEDLSDEQKSAAMEYGKRLMQYQGYNARRVQNQKESTDEANAINNAYDEGAEIQTPSDKHKAKVDLDKAEAELGAGSEDADSQLFASMVMAGKDNPVQTINSMAEQGYSDEQIQKAKNYYTAYHRKSGLTDAVIDRVNETIERVNAEVDANTNRDNGSVTQVILRDGSFGYVVQGTVVAGEENSVDVNNSDDTIMVRLQNGEVKMMNPNKDLSVVKWMQSPETLKEENNTILRRQLIDKEIGEIDWNPATPNPKVGDSFGLNGAPVTIVGQDGNGGMFVAPTEEWQAAQGNEKQMKQLVVSAQQSGSVPVSEYMYWTSAQIDAQEEAAATQQESAVKEPASTEMQQAEEPIVNEGAVSEQETKQPTLEDIVASLPKTKKGDIDYSAMTPQQQYQYTSLSESPEVALGDLQADIAANEAEISKVQEQLANAKGGKRAELRDKIRKMTSENEELKTFLGSVAPAPVENEADDNIEPVRLEDERAKYEEWVSANIPSMTADEYDLFEETFFGELQERSLSEAEINDFISTFVDEFNALEYGRYQEGSSELGRKAELNEQQEVYPESEGSSEILYGAQPLQARGNTGIAEESTEANGGVVGENGNVPESTSGSEVISELEKAREEVDQNPTEAQKEAGNYKKGHIKIDGYDITIENPKGGVRSGTDKNGKEWSITMNNDYGYIRGTEAVDGDHIDVFLSYNPTEGNVFVVDQSNEDGRFDESKVMYGFNSLEEARAAYLSNYEKGWESRIMAITEVSKDEFKKWIDSSHRKTKAFSEYKSVKANEQKPYTIEPATYTTKKGKVLDMFLVKPTNNEMSRERQSEARFWAKDMRGWYDRKEGGWMLRSKEDADKFVEKVFGDMHSESYDLLSMKDMQSVNDGEVSFTEPQKPAEESGPVWQYIVHVDKESGYTSISRDDVSGPIPIGDGRFILDAYTPEEMLEILRNPQNNMQDVLDSVGTTLENSIKTRELDRKIKEERKREYEELRKNGLNGFKIGDKVVYTPIDKTRKTIEATIYDFEEFGEHNPVLDIGLAPVMYEVVQWGDISKVGKKTEEQPKKQYHGGDRVFSTKHNANKDIYMAHHVGESIEYLFTDGTKANENEVQDALPEYKEKPNTNPSGNKLVTDERYAELRERMKKKLGGQMNIGIDPEILAIGTEMAVYHIEKGARKFAEYAKEMISDLGDAIRPYLKSFYNGARDLPEVQDAGLASEMTPYEEVSGFDVTNFDKNTINVIETAENIAKEAVVEEQKEIAKVRVKKQKKTSKKQKENVSLLGDLFNQNTESNDETRDQQRRKSDKLPEGDKTQNSGMGSEAREESAGSSVRGEAGSVPGYNVSDTSGSGRIHGVSGVQQPIKNNIRNFSFGESHIELPTGEISKLKANIEAIRTLKEIEASGQPATESQKAVLSKYVGWGGLSAALDEQKYLNSKGWLADRNWNEKYLPYYIQLKELLNVEEFNDAVQSTTTSHYTPEEIIRGMWSVVEESGFNGGRINEPAAGVGHIIGFMPKAISEKSTISGTEIDSLSGRIAKVLYPDANIKVQGYEKEFTPQSKDLVITNVPFGKTAPYDKALDKTLRKKLGSAYNLHNYFIAKGLLELKEGGIGVFVTSSATMDGANSKFREWVAANGIDLVGAIRLPNNAFLKNAGTSVTADMLVFRKRKQGERSNGVNFISNTQIGEGTYKENGETRTKPIMINEYFAERPEMMLGTMMTAHDAGSGGLYSGASQTLVAKPGADLEKELQDAISKIDMSGFVSQSTEKESMSTQPKATDLKNGTLVVEDNNVFVSVNGELQPVESASKKKEFTFNGKKRKVADAVSDYNSLKETLKSLIKAEQSNVEDPEPLRKELNRKYDSFVEKYGTLNRNKALDNIFAEDFEHNLPLSLENVRRVPSDTGKSMVWEVTKGEGILTKRVSYPVEEPKTAESIDDAINISRSYRGIIDVPYIASILNKSELDVMTEILQEGLAYRDPITGNLEDKGTYLSGNVMEKLEQARAMAETYPEEYQKNVDDLSAVQPETVRFGDISYRIGTPWIPTQYINDFALDVLGIKDLDVAYVHTLNEFVVSKTARLDDFAKSGQFRTERVGVIDLIEYALNQRNPKIFDKRVTYGPFGKSEERIPNEAETQAAAEKIMEISDKFIEYIDGRKEIHRELERIYNDKYNNYRLKEYEMPSFDHYPNSNREITLRDHQKKAVQRCLSESTLLAHQVGTGKTFTMITTAMEMRRLGIANKPMIVVQNATLEDFVKDFYKLYPGANVLAPGKDERSAENRKRLFNLIATGDFDAIVIPQSFMQFIPDDEGRKKELIQKRIDEYEQAMLAIDDRTLQIRMQKELDALRDTLEEAKSDKKKKRSVKDIANAGAKIKVKTEQVLDRRTDDVLTFEQMGIDALFIDEAHNFKKIGFASKMSNVKGIDTSASQRANSLLLKAQYVQEKNGGRNVILATGTPITNTMAEVWTMMKFVSPEILETYNIRSFDDFATTFGVVEPSLEFTATGNFKIADRFKSYVNVPELVKAFRSHADVVLSGDVKEFKEDNRIPKLKDGQMTNVVIEKNEDLEDVMDILIKRLEAYNEMSGEEKRRWSALPLVVFSRAKQAAIDLRLLNPSYEDNPNSKTNHVVRNVLKLYKESTPDKGAQLVFCDSYQSPGEAPKMDLFDYDPDVPRFNLYEDIKRKLVEGGIPSNEIAIVNNYDGERRKQLFEKVRNGDVRILLGSTEKMGVGVNVQDRLYALHHIDAPIRPMDFEQRNGRILRQGNLYAKWGKPVNVVTYGVQGTLDATAYDRLRVKQDFINQMMKGDVSGRVMEEQDDEDPSGMTFNQMAATLSGDQTAQLLFVAENHLKKLRNSKRSDANSKSGMAESMQSEKKRLETLKSKAQIWESANATVNKYFPEGVTDITVNGTTFTEKFGPALDPIVDAFEEEYSLNRGIAPLKMKLNGGNAGVIVRFLEGRMVYELYAGKDHIVESRQITGGKGLVSSIEHQIKATKKNLDETNAKIAEIKNKITGLAQAISTPWGREDELKEAEKKVADLKKQLEEKALENSKKKPVEQPRNEVEVEDNLERTGEGALTEDEVSMANDPVGKVLGKSTRTASERKSFAERERQRMIDRVTSLAKKLGLNNVEIVTEASTLTGAQRKAKGFYSKSKRKITIVIPNHSSVFDAEQTLLHEAVAHYGLRELFGAHFDVFLNNVYRNASSEVRERINRLTEKNGWDFRTATEEYLASLAEDTNFENMDESWWNKIKQFFLDMLNQIGFPGFSGVTLTDNELRYILWRSYENLSEPGKYRSIFGEAADIVKQDSLKVGNYSSRMNDEYGKVAEGNNYNEMPEDIIQEFEEIVANHPDIYAVRTEADIDALPTDRYTKRDIKEKFNNPRVTGTNVEGGMMILFVDRMDETELRATIPHELAHFASRNLKIEESYKMSALSYLQKHFPNSYEKVKEYPREKWSEEAVSHLFEEKVKELGFERILNGKFDTHNDIGYIFYNITNFLNHGRRNNPLRYGERSSSQRANDGEGNRLLQEKGVFGNAKRQVQQGTGGSVSSNDRSGNDRELGSVSGTSMGMGDESRTRKEEVEDDNLYRTGDDIEGMADDTARKLYEDSLKGKSYRFQEGFQDSMLALKKLQEAIVTQHGGKLEEWEDAYTAENQMSSRDTSEIENYTFNFFNPMLEQVNMFTRKTGLSYDELKTYLFAKSGLERNRDFAVRDSISQRAKDGEDVSGIYEAYMQRKKDLLDDLKTGVIDFRTYCEEMDNEAMTVAPDITGRDYSGISSLFDPDNFTEEAINLVESVEQSAGWLRFEPLWDSIKAANQFTLDRSKKSGVMSTDNHKKVSEMFEWYIPMRGWNDTKARDVYEYFGSQEGVFNPTVKAAGGRKSLADDPLATMANMAESAIFQGNKNQMKQKLLNLAFDKPTNLITVMDSWIENKGTEKDPKWEYVYPDISQDDDADVVSSKIKIFEEEMNQKADEGRAKKIRGKADVPYIATPKEIAEHIIRVKRNGREFVMILNGNPRAAQAINGMTNPETYNGIIERVSRRLNQFMASAFTTKNPTFIMRNLSRDLIFSNTAVAIKENVQYGRKFRSNQVKVLGNMRGLMKRYRSGNLDMNNDLDRMFKEFIANGGETGFAQLTSVDEYKKKIQRNLKDAKNGGVVSNGKKVGRFVMDTIEFYNRCAEDVSRFTVYMTSRQEGRSIQRSVNDAKEITVNFNKRGSGSKAGGFIGFGAQSMRSLYLFWNAAVQALVNFKRLGQKHPVAFTSAISLYAASGFIMPVVNEFLSSILGGDDDDYENLPEWVRRNNLVISLGKWDLFGGDAIFFTVPLPVEMRAFYGLGETANQVLAGNVRGKDAAMQIVGQFAEMLPLNFVTDAAGPWNAFTPDAFKPIVQAYIANKDWTGKPIYRDNGFNKNLPEWTKAYAGTSNWLVNSAELMNEFTGGDKYKSGLVDINPARLEHLFTGYLGGFGDMILGAAKTMQMPFDEKYRNFRHVPVVKAFVNQSDERTSYSQVKKDYASFKEEYEETVRRINGYKKERRNPEKALEYAERTQFLNESIEMRRYDVMRRYEKQLNKLYKQMRENPDTEVQKSINETINQIKADAVKALRAVK